MAGDLPDRPGPLRLTGARSASGRERLSPEALFVLGGVCQYAGATIAVQLFDHIRPGTVAWLRVLGGALALLVISGRRVWRGWTLRTLGLVAAFGTATALMNLFIYLALDRLDLGKAVAIEFIGPVAVAAVATRSRRNAVALGLAVAGVVLLSQIEFDVVGTGFVVLASAMWAGYIVTGHRVARLERGLGGLAVGLLVGSVVIFPAAVAGFGELRDRPSAIPLALVVGVLSTALAYGIDQLVMRRVSARRFSVMQALLPLIAAAMGALVLAQRPRPIEAVGLLLILVAVAAQSRDT